MILLVNPTHIFLTHSFEIPTDITLSLGPYLQFVLAQIMCKHFLFAIRTAITYWSQSQPGRCGEEKIPLTLPGFESRPSSLRHPYTD
jgi:hypothetical protein